MHRAGHGWMRALPPMIAAVSGGVLLLGTGDPYHTPAMADGIAPSDPLLADPAALRAAYSVPPENWPAFVVDASVAGEVVELGAVPEPVYPADNPYSRKKADLGEMLFFDPRLSATNQMACASCHDPDLGWADGRTVSFGVNRKVLPRNAPPAQHSGHLTSLFWDGRASTLEELTLKVIENRNEMHGFGDKVALKLNRVPAYRELFAEAFAEEPDESAIEYQPVTIDRVQKAVATFVRTVNGHGSRFDAFVEGRHDALSDAELRGLHLFRTQAGCMNCHHGPVMSDSKLHVTGLHLYGRPGEDLGAFLVTGKQEDRGAFRTPMLRNIGQTRPFMHDGLFHSLENVVAVYNTGIPTGKPKGKQREDAHFPRQSELIKPLGLSDRDLMDLVSLLRALDEPTRRVVPPKLPDFPPGE